MAKIDANSWKEFDISEIFLMKNTKSIVQKDILIDSGNVPYVTASSENNGVMTYIECPDEWIDKGNCIMIGGKTLAFSYQKYDFCSNDSHNIALYLKNSKCADEIHYLFLMVVLKATLYQKYSWGDSISMKKIVNEKFFLPVDSKDEPDWKYMEQYMQNILNEVGSSIENLIQTDNRKHEINISEWKNFVIGELFEKLQLGIKKKNFNKVLDVSEERTDEFNLPLINAKHGNNGVMYYGREEDFETAEMTIDIVQNGAIATGDVYAQPQKTGVLWDAYLIKSKQEIKSPEALLFISTVLEKTIKDKFSYDDKCVWDKASLLSIKLPVDNNGNPDYTYMESYMKSMMDSAKSEIDEYSGVHYPTCPA